MKVVRSQDCSLKLKVTETFQETSFMDDGFSTVRFQGVHCSAEGRLWSQGQESWYESRELDEFYWRFRVFQGWNGFFFWLLDKVSTKAFFQTWSFITVHFRESPYFQNRLGKLRLPAALYEEFHQTFTPTRIPKQKSFMIPPKDAQ